MSERLKLYFVLIFAISSITPNISIASQSYTPRSPNPILESWRWMRFPYLESKGVRCLAEAHDGTMWFGVNDGLLRYDGSNWEFYGKDKGLRNEPVLDIINTRQNYTYLYTSSGIYKLNNDYWDLVLDIEIKHRGNTPPTFTEISDGSVWLGTQYGMLQIKNDRFTFFSKEGIVELPSDVKSFHNDPLMLENTVLFYEGVAEDDQGGMYFGISGGHFYYTGKHLYNPDLWKFYKATIESDYWSNSKIIQASDGKIWIIFESDIRYNLIYNPKTDTWKRFKLSPHDGNDLNASIIETNNKRIWIGGFGKLHSFYQGKWTVYQNNQVPLPQSYIRIVQTSDGSLWIYGYKNDVYRIDYSSRRWKTYNGLHFQCETAKGVQWFISVNHKVVRYDGTTWSSFDESDGLIDGPVALALAKDDQLWAAGYHDLTAATAVFDGEKWSRQVHKNVARSIDYRAVFHSKDGSMWFGAYASNNPPADKRGVLRYNPALGPPDSSTAWEHIYKESKRFHESRYYYVRGIGQRSDGLIFFTGRPNYIFTFDGYRYSFYDGPEAFVNDPVDFQFSTSDGELYFGTRSEGLFHYNNKGVWEQHTVENGLSSNTITAILALQDSSILVATDKDICKYDGKYWTTNVFPSQFNIYREGGSLKQSRNGNIWINQASESWYLLCDPMTIPGSETFSFFRTIRYQPERTPPETEIVQYDNHVSPEGNTSIFWRGQDPWNITPTQSLQFSYKIDNQDWTPFTTERYHTFLSLSGGRHVFQVRSRDHDLNIDPSPAKIEFSVAPPVWKEPWFIFVIVLIVSLIVVYEIRISNRNRHIHQLDLMKLRLFTNISHEFKTPLTLILGPLEKLLATTHKDNPALYRQYDMMHRNAKRLLRLVNQVMNFRKMEAGKLKLELACGDLVHFARNVSDSFQSISEEKNIRIYFESSVDSLYVWFDPDKLDNILFNILSNSFKFTPKNGLIYINISVLLDDQHNNGSRNQKYSKNDMVQIRIKDTGIGIPANEINHVFERYYQVGDSRVHGIHGTGIGLSLAKELVELHNGSIAIDSKVGEGTEITIHLPLKQSLNAEEKHVMQLNYDNGLYNDQIADSHPENLQLQPNELPLLLIIDDNSDIRTFIRDELQNEYRIIEADEGNAGFETAITNLPDLIISDIMLPGINGILLCKKLKQDKRTSHIPIILLTVLGSERSRIVGWETGADDYITKPFNILLLKTRINNLLFSRDKLRSLFGKEIHLRPKDIIITSADEKFLQRAIDIVEKNMTNEEFGVSQFINEMGMSKSPLYKKLKSLTDQTPAEFIRTLKLKRASEMLSKGKMSVAEVAFELGFNNLSYFAKSFRKLYGVPPSSFAKTNE